MAVPPQQAIAAVQQAQAQPQVAAGGAPIGAPTNTNSPVGATITAAYVGRNVKAFAVFENEVSTLTFFNTLSTTLFSLGSSLGSIAIGIWVSSGFADALTPTGTVLRGFFAPLLCALAVVSFALAIWAQKSRSSTLDTIKKDTQQIK